MDADDANLVHKMGHRTFVGGNDDMWSSIGTLQFEFLKNAGLKPHHHFVDVACGSLRAGLHLIPYLDRNRYFGVEKHLDLIVLGVWEELGVDRFREKRPKFVISDTFEFEKLETSLDWGIAQSLFTHINAEDVVRCLTKLRSVAAPGMRFFATFHEVGAPKANPDRSHSHAYFAYTRSDMEAFGRQAGWVPNYIGSWNHPRHQKIIEYNP